MKEEPKGDEGHETLLHMHLVDAICVPMSMTALPKRSPHGKIKHDRRRVFDATAGKIA